MISQDNFDDEIDLREIAKTLLRYRWLILGATVILALAGYVFAKLTLPKQYEAATMVIITKPLFSANLDPRIQTVYQQPDAKSLTALALTDDIVLSVYESPDVRALFDEDVDLSAMKGRLEATVVGTTQLNLKVTDTDPTRAAQIVNTWAEIVTTRLNDLYDINQNSLEQIQAQVETARENWDSAEQAVIERLGVGRVDSLAITLAQKRESLKIYLDNIRSLDLLISDAQAMDAYLATLSQGDALTLDSDLALIALQQRAAGGLAGLQIQLVTTNIPESPTTVATARVRLQALVTTLQSQRVEFQDRVAELPSEITDTSADLEAEQYQVTQLTTQRDLALSAYQALSSQVVEAQITLAQNDRVVKVAGQAQPPESASGPRASLYGAVSGAAGLFLSVCMILLVQWWRSPAQPGKSGKE